MPELPERLRAALADRYRITGELGRGGMAVVYRAEDLKHGREVAIKVLRPELTAQATLPERFLREIRIAARLTHPHILPVHDSGELDGFLFFVMPVMGCESLRDRMRSSTQLPIDEVLRLATSVAGALGYAHRQQVVHRDIKPENILLHEGQPVVADFGVARAISAVGGESITEHGIAVGTPDYMSPEQATADREVDALSDQYSLACVVYEMLAGRPPFRGTNVRAVMASHVLEPVPPLRSFRPEVPPAIEQAIVRALAKEPGDRFPTIVEFAEALVTPLSGFSQFTPGLDAGPRSRRAIAVLPLVNASGDPENEYFSDGMTDELINALAQVDGLRVASRTSVFALKGRREDVRAIGALLNVSAVLEGTVRRQVDRFRITVQLTDVTDGRHLWSARYDRDVRDVFAVQDEIARTIVTTLRATLLGDLGAPVPRRYTENVKAYNLYLKGRYAWNYRRTAEGMKEAIRYFEQAIAEDPRYALAYTGLADCYAMEIDYRSAPVDDGMRRAKAEALKALELDETLAEAHTSLAWVTFIYEWDWIGAEREFRRAIELNPRYPVARQWHAWLLTATGRPEEGREEAAAAVELDPASVSMRRSLGWLSYYAHRPAEAIDHVRRALVMNPTAEESHLILGMAYAQAGRFDEAVGSLREAMAGARETDRAETFLARVAVATGRPEEARAMLGTLEQRAERRYVSPVDFALIHLALGDVDQAFEWMDRAYQHRRGWLAYLKVEPALDGVRADPRFSRLLTVMQLDDRG